MIKSIFLVWSLLITVSCTMAQQQHVPVLVVGGGTGGTSAAIASARTGVKTLLIEEGPWLGGMISAAGVTCTDGNHNLPSGLWNEFRNHLYKIYGGPKAVATGWVSHTQFEPHVSDSIWKMLAHAEPNLTIMHGWQFESAISKGQKVSGAVFRNTNGEQLMIHADVTIDATELGDVFASAGASFSLGMEAGNDVDENVGVNQSNKIVQDLTWVAILKDYGPKADCTIIKPAGYTPDEFDGACTDYYKNKSLKAPNVDGRKMLDYGRLPNGKYMINWPNAGNDTYLNVVEMTAAQRTAELEKAKQTTLRFVYFIQEQLGFKNLGLADDEFPTKDRLALMPYHREGRRVQGLVRMNIRNIAEPYTYGYPLYRTGIAVGDYPIDHHHKKNPAAPQHLDFYAVPSYNIPLGALIPASKDGLIAAEKGISVTNVVNGTTRLQPVVILIGQAAGTLAALSIQRKSSPRNIPVRIVQEKLLESGAYLMPYFDVKPGDIHFKAIQKIGATGILKGKGIPYQWANQTWFYPDSTISSTVFSNDFAEFQGSGIKATAVENRPMTIGESINALFEACKQWTNTPCEKYCSTKQAFVSHVASQWAAWQLKELDESRPITRRELAVLLNEVIDPFHLKGIDHKGHFINQ